MLEAIAGSMITVAGVAFSITIVSFALASSQYTSRILRNFMPDRANQTVLGVFLGIFAYCLVVLRTIRGGDDGLFVPSVAVLAAVLLALLAVGFLVFFIHHISASIQASSIIQAVAAFGLTPIPSGGGTVRHMVFDERTGQLWFGTDANTIGRAQVGEARAALR